MVMEGSISRNFLTCSDCFNLNSNSNNYKIKTKVVGGNSNKIKVVGISHKTKAAGVNNKIKVVVEINLKIKEIGGINLKTITNQTILETKAQGLALVMDTEISSIIHLSLNFSLFFRFRST